MHIQSKIQKWGNSSAIRLPTKILAASGISSDSEVDIQASEGRLVIQLHETTNEQIFDKLFAEMPEAEEWIWILLIFITNWRMPLFFLLSGFFSVLIIQKRGDTRFLLDRTVRIGVTCLIFCLIYVFGTKT